MIKNIIIAIIRIVVFCYIFILLFTFISYMQKPLAQELENMSGIYGYANNSLDVIYIGGSATFVYYAPLYAWDKYGVVSYDYATNTIQAEVYKHLVKEALKTQKPKLIIIDARAYEYRDERQVPSEVPYRSALIGMRFSLNKLEFINNNVGKNIEDKDKLSYIFDIIKYHTTIKYSEINKQIMNKKHIPVYNGFQFILRHSKVTPQAVATSEKLKVSENTNQILLDLLEYIKKTNIDYLFVVSPYAETKTDKKKYNYIESIITEKGYKFLDANDYSREMNLNYATDFYNNDHVNIFGAEKYTDFLSNYIINNYNIPNRKNDKRYEYMNENLEAWYKDVENAKTEINKIIRNGR